MACSIEAEPASAAPNRVRAFGCMFPGERHFEFGRIVMKRKVLVAGSVAVLGLAGVAIAAAAAKHGFDEVAATHARTMLDEGKKTFRFDTFGSEAFWGDALQLHKAIAGAKNGGVGRVAENRFGRRP
jgi:hypothetical protein